MREISLTQGKVALVDDADFEFLNQWKWCIRPRGNTIYACRKTSKIDGRRQFIQMHRLILGLTDSKVFTDHKDGNGLNNQRSNLRIATHVQNSCNRSSMPRGTSKFKGVSWRTDKSKWAVQITFNGKDSHVGFFISETEAAKAYNAAAIKIHGEFANINAV